MRAYIQPCDYSELPYSLKKQDVHSKATDLSDELLKILMKNEEEIAELRTKNPDAESQEVSLAFELNKRTKNSLSVL